MESAIRNTATIEPFINNRRRLLFFIDFGPTSSFMARPPFQWGLGNTNLFLFSFFYFSISFIEYIYTPIPRALLLFYPLLSGKLPDRKRYSKNQNGQHKSLIKVWQKKKEREHNLSEFSGVTNNPVRHHRRGK